MKPVRIPSASFCMLTFVAILAALTSTHAAAQSSTSPSSGAGQGEMRRRQVRAPSASASAATLPTFYVLAFAGTLVHGKCLDFGPPPQVVGSPVFIYGCNGTVAQQVRVEEINDRHEVILHAGRKVIGIRNPMTNTPGGAAPGVPAPTEFRLELQDRANPVRPDSANQIFALDGDSIILARSRPCISTDASVCPAPPPQLVVQVQNARGANRSPLIVGPRNLADSEFWEFKTIDGSGRFPTSGFVPVATNYDLWNAVCKTPTVKRLIGVPVIDDPGQMDDGMVAFTGPFVSGTYGGCAVPNIGWGRVIVVTDGDPNECVSPEYNGGPLPGVGPCIDLSYYPPVVLPAGVTLRGNRRGTNFGPQLYFFYLNLYSSEFGRPTVEGLCDSCMLQIHGDYTRVTGLRLRGQSRSTTDGFYTTAIQVDFPGPAQGPPPFSPTTMTQYIATIDHNDISDWGEAAVALSTPYSFNPEDQTCTFTGYMGPNKNTRYPCSTSVPAPFTLTLTFVPIANDPATLANVRVARNFLHHNERDNGGYGVNVSSRASIEGNIFLMNRHAITAGGEPHTEYRASYNLVLSSAPQYTGFCLVGFCHNYYNQDFDVHGTEDKGHWYNGQGGYHADIFGNTFLATNRENFELRGFPSLAADFHSNISLQSQDNAINFKICANVCGGPAYIVPITIVDDQFELHDPTVRLGPASLRVGDFDGDGDDDLFLATGAAWYYSPAGAREWRFLSAKPDTIDQLLFGDFDGDGRTDVVALRSGLFMVSWGGVSDWEVLNPDPTGGRLLLLPSAITAMAVGDFDGDGRSDIFWADGQTWWVSYGGNTPFVEVQTSSHRVKELRFGDFDRNGTTDIFSVVSDGVSLHWMVSYSPKLAQGTLFSSWTYLPVSLTNTVDGLLVADFDGDGIADVATNSADGWQISYKGAQGWTDVPQSLGLVSLALAGVGHFEGQAGADVLLWNGLFLGIMSLATCDSSANVNTQLCISVGGASPATRYSTQDMR